MHWIKSLGTLDPIQAFTHGPPLPLKSVPPHPEIERVYTTLKVAPGKDEDGDGERAKTLTAIRHSAEMGRTPVQDVCAPMRRDAHEAIWEAQGYGV